MRKLLASFLTVTLVMSLVACSNGSGSKQASENENKAAQTTAAKKPGSVNLSVCLALGQWTDKFDAMVTAYKANNPQIGKIESEFPSSSTYWDLIKSKLASGEMPDVFGCGFGEQIANYKDYLADLSNISSAKALTPDQVKACSVDGKTIQVMPMVMEGWGILYNMRLLKQVGYNEPPKTISQLKKLCADLKAAGIQPFGVHYAETSLTLVNHLGSIWITNKQDPMKFFLDLKAGKNMNLDKDAELNAELDYYDLVLQYAQPNAIATDKVTARNNFFLEKYAMIDDEGSWEIPNIMDVNPKLKDYVVQGVVPIMDDASKNKLQTASICAGVYAKSKQLDEAKAFLDWLVSSDTANKWHQDVMGNIPTLSTTKLSDNLACLGKDVYALKQKNLTFETMTPWTPDSVKDSLGEAWSLYVGKKIDRAAFYKKYQDIWTNYASKK